MTTPRIGDPAIDLANGRALVVLEKAADRADTWSEENEYELLENYGNERLGASASDSVWTCAYVASLQSEPSKTYDFPESRLGVPAYWRADGLGRVYERVTRDVLEHLFTAVRDVENVTEYAIRDTAVRAGFEVDVIQAARELADVEERLSAEEAGSDE